MGALGGPLGLNGGYAGSGSQGPSAAAQPNTLPGAMNQQQDLLDALRLQNGLGNQTSVFNQLQGVANGQGPNPAQAMLNQETAKNVSNQAALMAGQRGAGANVGLMARQAGQQGGNLQQQAVGQGASLQAQQALNALGQMGGVANTQAQNQIGQTNEVAGSNQALYNLEIQKQQGLNAANNPLILQNMKQGQAAVGGFFNGMGSMMGSSGGGGGGGGAGMAAMAAAGGGMVPGYADGGDIGSGPQSSFGRYLKGVSTLPGMMSVGPDVQQQNYNFKKPKGGPDAVDPTADSQQASPDDPTVAGPGFQPNTEDAMGPAFKSGGLVDVVVSPNEKIVPPAKVDKAAGGKVEAKTVPGKAKVSGDSYENDTVPMKVPPGSIVIPRSRATNERDAASFVRSVLAKRGRK